MVKVIKNRSFEKGRQKAKKAYEDRITQALINGAGPAHRMTAVDHMLPPLRLTVEKTTKEGKTFITDPIEVAKEHSKPWKSEWRAFDPSYHNNVVKFFKTCCRVVAHICKAIVKYFKTCCNTCCKRL